jgi:hypothetical protein
MVHESLPEFQSLTRVWFCAESQIKNSRQRSLCREFFYLSLGTEKTLGKQTSLPRAKQKALGTHKNTRQRFLYQEPTGWLSAKNFFAKCNFLTLGKENLNKSLFCLQFFSILNIHLYKTYAQIWHNFSSICYI